MTVACYQGCAREESYRYTGNQASRPSRCQMHHITSTQGAGLYLYHGERSSPPWVWLSRKQFLSPKMKVAVFWRTASANL